MAVYSQLEVDYRQSLVLSLLMIALSVVVIAAMRNRWFGASR
jgi:molybdate transport system permease protein